MGKKKVFLGITCLLAWSTLNAQVTIGSDNGPNTGAILDMKQYVTADNLTSGKGFNLPRVALQDPHLLQPCAETNPTTKDTHKGLVVYNMTENSALSPGIHFWDGESWQQLVDERPLKVTGFDMVANVNSTATGITNTEAGSRMSFGDTLDGTTNTYYFRIEDPGSYAFAIRLYGEGYPLSGATAGRACVYLTLLINGVKIDVQEVDISLVDASQVGVQNKLSGTVMLIGSELKKNDRVDFVFSHYNGGTWSRQALLTTNPGLNANKTSLVFWKI